MADISKVTLLDGVTYNLKDGNAIPKPSGGTTGQVLTKTANGQEWATPSGGGNVDTVNGIEPDENKNVQTVIELTQAEYDDLEEPDPNVVYLITDSNDYNADKIDITLYAANWSDAVYTISDNHIGTDTVQLVSPREGITDTQLEALQGANIQSYGQTTGELYIKAYGDVPEIDIPVSVIFHPGVQVRELEQSNVYSTNETVVGTWIDGKPIYRKVIEHTFSATGSNTIDVSNLSINHLINIYGYVIQTNSNEFVIPYRFSNDDALGIYLENGRQNIKVVITGPYAVGPAKIVIEYTKTTD